MMADRSWLPDNFTFLHFCVNVVGLVEMMKIAPLYGGGNVFNVLHMPIVGKFRPLVLNQEWIHEERLNEDIHEYTPVFWKLFVRLWT
jgi:hypothetical protein